MKIENVNTIRITIEWGDLKNTERLLESSSDDRIGDTVETIPIFMEELKVDAMIPLVKSIAGTDMIFSDLAQRLILMRVMQMIDTVQRQQNIVSKPPNIIIPNYS